MIKKTSAALAFAIYFLFTASALYSQTDLEKCLTGKWKWHPFNGYIWLKHNGMVGDAKSDWAKWRVADESKNTFEIIHFKGSRKGTVEKLKYAHLGLIKRQENDFVMGYKEVEEGLIVHSDPPRFFTGYWVPLHPNGKPARKVPFINGVKHGTGQWFYPGGNVQYRTNWNAGKPNGEEIEYYDMPGSKVKSRASYINGEKNGMEIHYDPQGKEVKRINWRKGKQVN